MIAFLEARKAGLFRRGDVWRNVVAGVIALAGAGNVFPDLDAALGALRGDATPASR
ncbi:MAG: hypothetical protein ACREST_04665 [Steroidobacteraceae bacterium]